MVSGTASHPASGASGSGKGSVQEYHRQQAETSREDGPTILKPSAHGVHLPRPDITSKYSAVHGIC
jgi:hypothetical protein